MGHWIRDKSGFTCHKDGVGIMERGYVVRDITMAPFVFRHFLFFRYAKTRFRR